MALVGREEARDIPHEPGESMTLRALTGVELDEADERGTARIFRTMKGIDQSVLNAMQSMADSSPEARRRQRAAGYDRQYLLERAIVGWSYDAPCTPENIAKLDARTRDWAVSAVLDMNMRDEGEASDSGTQ